LRQYRADHPPIDIALLPVNGLRPVLGPPLVMGPQEAVASAKILGAHTLVPIHDAHAPDPLYIMIRRHGSAADARRLAQAELGTPDVITLRPGQRWTHRAGAGG
jgi:L-ascorbate metabolism protein UlaG (beta-lactamase superfamily)